MREGGMERGREGVGEGGRQGIREGRKYSKKKREDSPKIKTARRQNTQVRAQPSYCTLHLAKALSFS